MSYQGYPQPWYRRHHTSCSVCHKRNLFTGSWGCPVSFTRHLFSSAPYVCKAMADNAHRRGVSLSSLVVPLLPSNLLDALMAWRRSCSSTLTAWLSTSSAYSMTCVRFCGVSYDTSEPVVDKYVGSTNPIRITCLFINGDQKHCQN